MHEPSAAQKQYLAARKKEKYIISLSRILIFLGFLFLWEISARKGWIDSFIFSSPTAIVRNFTEMCRSQELFSHIGITLGETLLSFFFVVILGLSETFADSGTLPCRPEQSPKIRSRAFADRLAGRQYADDRSRGYVRGDFRIHHQSVHRFS